MPSKTGVQQIIIEMPGARLYTCFCAECGTNELLEVETRDRIICSVCMSVNIRIIRDVAYEKAIKEQSWSGGPSWSQ